jgi:hypothetical protein
MCAPFHWDEIPKVVSATKLARVYVVNIVLVPASTWSRVSATVPLLNEVGPLVKPPWDARWLRHWVSDPAWKGDVSPGSRIDNARVQVQLGQGARYRRAVFPSADACDRGTSASRYAGDRGGGSVNQHAEGVNGGASIVSGRQVPREGPGAVRKVRCVPRRLNPKPFAVCPVNWITGNVNVRVYTADESYGIRLEVAAGRRIVIPEVVVECWPRRARSYPKPIFLDAVCA